MLAPFSKYWGAWPPPLPTPMSGYFEISVFEILRVDSGDRILLPLCKNM